MEQNYERMQEEVPTLSKYVHTDLGFHMLVCECTQNPLAVQILRSYEELLGPSILHMTEVIGAGNGLKYHQLLLEAIRAHDRASGQDRDAPPPGGQYTAFPGHAYPGN